MNNIKNLQREREKHSEGKCKLMLGSEATTDASGELALLLYKRKI